MTEDIVARLRRDLASGLSASIGDTEEAADEIERLRKDNAHLDRMRLAAIDSVGVVRAETKQAAAARSRRRREALLEIIDEDNGPFVAIARAALSLPAQENKP